MARLYTNENFPQPAVDELRRLGHDVLTTHEANNSNAAVSDQEVVRFASACDRIVVTLNRRDFIRIHGSSRAHAGIVVCTVDPDFVALARRIDAALPGDGARGELLRVSRAAARPAAAGE
jgi:predicted nuclease of predicted toxin-antitoxin system